MTVWGELANLDSVAIVTKHELKKKLVKGGDLQRWVAYKE